ncbi:hypothetical protein F5I97DRAFT_1803631, partial [Phlebopus sp. FC_14]
IHPDLIDQYYGTDDNELYQLSHQTEAGHPADEDDRWNDLDIGLDVKSLTQAVADNQSCQLHHKAVEVPTQWNPFPGEHAEQLFFSTLQRVIVQDIVSNGLRLKTDE